MTTIDVVQLEKDIKSLELDHPGGPQLQILAACVNVLTAKLTAAVAVFEANGGFGLDHAPNMAAWLTAQTQITRKAANTMCRQGRLLRSLPLTAQAWVTGGLTAGQVQAMFANLTSTNISLFAEAEPLVVPLLCGASVRETVAFMTKWRATADAVLDGPEPTDPDSELRLNKMFNGRFQLTGNLSSLRGEMLEKALQLARPTEVASSPAAANAAAFDTIVAFYLDHQTTALGGRHRPHVNIIVDLPELNKRAGQGRLLDGTPVGAKELRALLCDCNIHRVITNGPSSILDYGRSTRTFPPALYTVLVLRDGGCRYPDCDRKPQHCDAHHVVPWEKGGETSLNNAALFCKYHHLHCCHGAGWRVAMDSDATIHLTTPTGQQLTSHPPSQTRISAGAPLAL